MYIKVLEKTTVKGNRALSKDFKSAINDVLTKLTKHRVEITALPDENIPLK